MVVGFTTTYAISAYHHWCCEFEFRSGRGVQHYVRQWLAAGRGFSPSTPVSSTNKTDRHDITEILLKVALNTKKKKQPNKYQSLTWQELTYLLSYSKNSLLVLNHGNFHQYTLTLNECTGSWIYNYICNQCLSPLKFWVRIPLRRGVLNTTLCDKVCQWLVTGWWFSPGTSVSFTNKTDFHHITEILLKKAFNIITLTLLITFCKSTWKHRMSFYITWSMMTISIYNTKT